MLRNIWKYSQRNATPILVYVSIYNKRKASDGAAVTASVPDTDPGTGIEIQWTKLMNNQSRVWSLERRAISGSDR